MRGVRFVLAVVVALAATGCMRHEPDDVADRGLFNSRPSAPRAYAQQPGQKPSVLQYVPPRVATPQYGAGGPYVAAPDSYAAASPYTLDAGDKLRIVVFGQDGISNAYIVDAGGNVNLPLIGPVPARGSSTQQLSQRIAERLTQGYVREPHVTGEKAIAIAGGFAPRAFKRTVELNHSAQGQQIKTEVPLDYPLRPGDTVLVKERWF
jgi:polysaccharide biosynthesis/export protein